MNSALQVRVHARYFVRGQHQALMSTVDREGGYMQVEYMPAHPHHIDWFSMFTTVL